LKNRKKTSKTRFFFYKKDNFKNVYFEINVYNSYSVLDAAVGSFSVAAHSSGVHYSATGARRHQQGKPLIL